MQEELFYNIYELMKEIPFGKVASYGQLARLIARDKNARLVGKALRCADMYGDFPCHRVVGSNGRLAFAGQRERLEEEGIVFTSKFVDMKKYQWKI